MQGNIDNAIAVLRQRRDLLRRQYERQVEYLKALDLAIAVLLDWLRELERAEGDREAATPR